MFKVQLCHFLLDVLLCALYWSQLCVLCLIFHYTMMPHKTLYFTNWICYIDVFVALNVFLKNILNDRRQYWKTKFTCFCNKILLYELQIKVYMDVINYYVAKRINLLNTAINHKKQSWYLYISRNYNFEWNSFIFPFYSVDIQFIKRHNLNAIQEVCDSELKLSKSVTNSILNLNSSCNNSVVCLCNISNCKKYTYEYFYRLKYPYIILLKLTFYYK